MALLEPAGWSGRIFSGGWVEGAGESYPAVEPATGRTLGRVEPRPFPTSTGRFDALAGHNRRGRRRRTKSARRCFVGRRTCWSDRGRDRGLDDSRGRRASLLGGGRRAGRGTAPGRLARQLPPRPGAASTPPRLSFTRQVPVGVVGVIAPFNAPLMLAARSVAPALAVGNAVALKPDPRTAVCGGFVLARVLEEAGLPADVFHVLPGGSDVGRELVVHHDVPVIAFTGSVTAGRAIAESAAPLLKRVHLELGGKLGADRAGGRGRRVGRGRRQRRVVRPRRTSVHGVESTPRRGKSGSR